MGTGIEKVVWVGDWRNEACVPIQMDGVRAWQPARHDYGTQRQRQGQGLIGARPASAPVCPLQHLPVSQCRARTRRSATS